MSLIDTAIEIVGDIKSAGGQIAKALVGSEIVIRVDDSGHGIDVPVRIQGGHAAEIVGLILRKKS